MTAEELELLDDEARIREMNRMFIQELREIEARETLYGQKGKKILTSTIRTGTIENTKK